MAPDGDNPGATERAAPPERIEMPAPTAWPMVLALGLVLLAAGAVTSWALSFVGAVVALAAVVGWVGELLPGAGVVAEEPAAERPRPIHGVPGRVEAMRPGVPGFRLHLPEKIHPYSAGVRGGFFGGIAMAVVAFLYGVVSGHGPWYPINLLGGMLLPEVETRTVEQLERFSVAGLVLGTAIHGVMSLGVGLIYGVLLPTLPRRPLFWSGLVIPLLWTGGIYAFMRVLNPPMRALVDWKWFVASQLAYGLTVGYVVMRSELVHAARVRQGPGELAEEAARAAEEASEGTP